MSHETLQLIALVVGVGLWIGVGYYAHTLGRRWYVWMPVALVTSPVFVLIVLVLCGMTNEKLTQIKQAKLIEAKPTQIEKDMRAVARILNERELPAKRQWNIVAGMIVLLVLGGCATVLYAQSIQPHHHFVTYQHNVMTPYVPAQSYE